MLAMDKSTLYSTAQNFAKKIKEARPDITSDPDACLCLIIASTQDIFSGVTSIKVDEGNVETYAAEEIAANALIAAGGARAKQMILITIEDFSFMQPNEGSLAKLMRASVENGACEIVLNPEESATAASLVTSVDTPDFLSGYDDDTPAPPPKEGAAVGAPAEFAAGFDVDESNPFYGGPDGAQGQPAAQGGAGVNSLFDQPSDAQEVGASGFPNPYMTPPQGYPQQGGFPQQQGMYGQGYPQQGGYPQQQGMYGQGYPQQGGYPQQNPYGGNPYQQQNMNPQNAAPYRGGYPNPSVHVGSNVPSMSAYQSQSIMNNAGGSSAAFKKRLSNFLGEEEDGTDQEGERLSKEDMLKMQKDKKKVAKASNNMKKKM